MRNKLRATIALTLSAFLLTSVLTGCETKEEVVLEQPVNVTQTHEFKNSIYQKNFYSNLDFKKEYQETLKGLTLMKDIYTVEGHKKLYKDSSGDIFFISGFMPIPIEKATNFNFMFHEETGAKMHPYGNEEVKLNIIQELNFAKSMLSEDFINLDNAEDLFYFNGKEVPMMDLKSTIADKTPDGNYALNLVQLGMLDYKVDEEAGLITFTVDPIVSPVYTLEIPYGADYEIVTDKDKGNIYYSAKYTEIDNKRELFVPIEAIKHKLGFDCNYFPELNIASIYTNDVYMNEGNNLYSDLTSNGTTEISGAVTPIANEDFYDEKGLKLEPSKESEAKIVDKGKPIPKEDSVKKPNKPAPTYTNAFKTTYVCDGSSRTNPPSLPPTDGDLWTWSFIKQEWYWDDISNPDECGGITYIDPNDYINPPKVPNKC